MSRLTTVNFKNDTLFAIESEEGIYVAIKPICDSLGIEGVRPEAIHRLGREGDCTPATNDVGSLADDAGLRARGIDAEYPHRVPFRRSGRVWKSL